MTDMNTKVTGSCLCGKVRFEVSSDLRPVVFCHCEQCRKTSGHYVAATACDPNQLKLTSGDGLRWYRSSPKAQRGFCASCGSSLFWRPDHERYIRVMTGALTLPTRLEGACHIYTHWASDYYSIEDGLPQFAEDYPEKWVAELE